ncbi:MAG: V-type ATP synthase subunit E [Spirochaetaceae bacterium]|nr:MAG: V-type ATP synthase subunit E [Spirochaetaceae bacterium]
MDAQLKEIIETIKSEGVQSAEKQAAQIVSEAEERGKSIVADAEKRAADIVRQARQEAEQTERTGRESLAQAGRDLVLNVEARLGRLFERVVQQTARESYDAQVLQRAIVKLVETWQQSGGGDITVQVGSDAAAEVEKALHARLGDQFTAGVTIVPVDGIDAGFRVSEKDGNAYYDFTAAGIAEILGEFVNPRLSEILREAVKE